MPKQHWTCGQPIRVPRELSRGLAQMGGCGFWILAIVGGLALAYWYIVLPLIVVVGVVVLLSAKSDASPASSLPSSAGRPTQDDDAVDDVVIEW